MKIVNKISVVILAVGLMFGLAGPMVARAATTPSLGEAATYAILGSTFTRNISTTTITGDLGYTTLSGSGTHTVSGATHVADASYNAAGTAQGAALTDLNNQACTFTFANGAIDLAADTTHGSIGVYTPGVYCTGASSAASIGTAGITLNGAGTFIFKVNGALTSVVNSTVNLTGGATACNVFWAPTAATTLAATTTFKGNNIDASGITIGQNVTWVGSALAFGGTVTADTDTVTVATACPSPIPPVAGVVRQGAVNVVKVVINDNGGTKTIADFPLFVNGLLVVSGQTNNFPAPAGVYTVTETSSSLYTRTFSGDCNSSGQFNLYNGNNIFCIVTNNDIGAPVVPPVPPLIDVVKVASPLSLPLGPGLVKYTYTLRNIGTVPVSSITMVGDTCSPIVLVSGDTNGDSKLDLNETWVHTCSTTLTETHTNTVVATGWANGISAVDIASANVVVGLPIVPPLIHVVKTPSAFTLPAPGGAVTYFYSVTNPGTAPLSDVSITDDKCTGLPGRVVGHHGDLNKNNLLESNETWQFTCKTNLTKTTTNIGTAQGSANGLTARDFSIVTVVVAAVVPKLPNTGFAPGNIALLAGILTLVSISLIAFLRKRTI